MSLETYLLWFRVIIPCAIVVLILLGTIVYTVYVSFKERNSERKKDEEKFNELLNEDNNKEM